MISSDEDDVPDGLLGIEGDTRKTGKAVAATGAAEASSKTDHPDYTTAAQTLSLMFSSPHDGGGSDNDAAPMSRAAIWGALHMHAGNTNEAAATLFDWHAQSPALLKELEGQGAKAIVGAGREGRSPQNAKKKGGKYWECDCGRAHLQTVLRCVCGKGK